GLVRIEPGERVVFRPAGRELALEQPVCAVDELQRRLVVEAGRRPRLRGAVEPQALHLVQVHRSHMLQPIRHRPAGAARYRGRELNRMGYLTQTEEVGVQALEESFAIHARKPGTPTRWFTPGPEPGSPPAPRSPRPRRTSGTGGTAGRSGRPS